MKRVLVVALVAVLFAAGCADAPATDENYHGEEGDQPAQSAEKSDGSGSPETGAAGEAGDRIRNKDR
jgi:PBP1b-binding outer membrane lipoprotein LpoB